ncbi:hypothetical protein Ocin01_05489 [Orchesella cincta]|uniref:Poly(3-hydroxyalkanoate) depolymerase C n=1 Tax=Orchesella cincta TaxID=48709 RepID=A0A1D2N7G8_ORCCI|nr:hypothetical protein Ocin01_05489 [Orchesella cincta]
MDSLISTVLLILSIGSVSFGSPPNKLAPMIVHHDKVTLSGFSSGGTFAQMLQFSYSRLFSGIAVFSHSYYRCGNGSGLVDHYDRQCTKLFNGTEFDLYNPDLVHKDIEEYVRLKKIDNPNNLKNKRLYVYTGLQNLLFTPRQSLSILSVYERYIASPESIFTRVQDANLVLPTDNAIYGRPCTEFSESTFFIGKCGFSGVKEALNFLLFHNSSDSVKTNYYNRESLMEFDQTEFTRGLPATHYMDSIGYYYVPKRCGSVYQQYRRCYLHFYFHGCASGREFANTTHIRYSGLLEVAEARNIIMIFPQAVTSKPENEIGCWDSFGISGEFYATQDGPQIEAVKRMLDRILQNYGSPYKGSSTSSSSSSGGYYPTKGNGNNNKPSAPTHSQHYHQYHQYSTAMKQKQNGNQRGSGSTSQSYGKRRG